MSFNHINKLNIHYKYKLRYFILKGPTMFFWPIHGEPHMYMLSRSTLKNKVDTNGYIHNTIIPNTSYLCDVAKSSCGCEKITLESMENCQLLAHNFRITILFTEKCKISHFWHKPSAFSIAFIQENFQFPPVPHIFLQVLHDR